jgi:thioredoxin reductase (NADPH)
MPGHDLQASAFPTLDEAQMNQLARVAQAALERFAAGQVLFQAGDRAFHFYVLVSGEVAMVDPAVEPPRVVTVHRRGQFTGEIAHLTGSPAPLSAVARTEVTAHAVSEAGLRELVAGQPELGDIILNALMARRQLLRQCPDFGGLRVIGSRHSADTFRIREFLARNLVLFTSVDLESAPDVQELLRRLGVTPADTPVVAGYRLLLRNPSETELAEALGLRRPIQRAVHDLVVVGCGPAGLAAAVYGASEGLDTLVLDRHGPGGQASGTMRIENYLGFPAAVSGLELAERAVVQARKFGARLSIPHRVVGLSFDNGYQRLHLDGGEAVMTRCLLIATGNEYRRLLAEGCAPFEGRGVFYAATLIEANLCAGAEVVVVGAGNSAGQAAVFLAQRSRTVRLLVRGDDLGKSMSAYLAHRIQRTPNIEVLVHTTVARILGNGELSAVEVEDSRTRERRILPASALFSFIGATPRTEWLPAEIERDERQFVRTGPALAGSPHWSGRRQPFLLETSRPGVFAAGDVRAGSIKRFASAVGEGAMAVQFVHEYLKEM